MSCGGSQQDGVRQISGSGSSSSQGGGGQAWTWETGRPRSIQRLKEQFRKGSVEGVTPESGAQVCAAIVFWCFWLAAHKYCIFFVWGIFFKRHR